MPKITILKEQFSRLTGRESDAKSVRAYLKEKGLEELLKLNLRSNNSWQKIVEEVEINLYNNVEAENILQYKEEEYQYEEKESPEHLMEEFKEVYSWLIPGTYDFIRVHNIKTFEDLEKARNEITQKYHPDLHPNYDMTTITNQFNNVFDEIQELLEKGQSLDIMEHDEFKTIPCDRIPFDELDKIIRWW